MSKRSSVRRTPQRRVPGADVRSRQGRQYGLPSGLSLLRSRFSPSGTNLPAGLLASLQGAAATPPAPFGSQPGAGSEGVDPRKWPGMPGMGAPTALQSPYGGIQTTPAPQPEQGIGDPASVGQPPPMGPGRFPPAGRRMGPRGMMGTPQSSFDPRLALQQAGLTFL